MQDEVQVYHHLGLGDHIICNGLIRELCKHYKKVYCFVRENNLYSVSFMYRDQPKIELIPIKSDLEAPLKFIKDVNLIKIGFENLDISNENFDKSFYNQLGYNFSLRWDNFYFKRDYETEEELYKSLNGDNSPYIFIHDDPSRRFIIDIKKINNKIKFIKPGNVKEEHKKYTIFHWMLILENAQEIHCMDSSFKCLVESIPHIDAKLFYHEYVRGSSMKAVSSTKKDWTIIKNPSLSIKVNNVINKMHKRSKRKLSKIRNCFNGYSPPHASAHRRSLSR
jgi:hypothetical protein